MWTVSQKAMKSEGLSLSHLTPALALDLKMLTFLPELTAFAHALFNSLWPSWPGWASQMFIWRKVSPVRKVILPSQKGDPATQVTLLVEPTFCFYVNGTPRFLKRWLHQGSLGRGSSDPSTQNIFFQYKRELIWHQMTQQGNTFLTSCCPTHVFLGIFTFFFESCNNVVIIIFNYTLTLKKNVLFSNKQ